MMTLKLTLQTIILIIITKIIIIFPIRMKITSKTLTTITTTMKIIIISQKMKMILINYTKPHLTKLTILIDIIIHQTIATTQIQ